MQMVSVLTMVAGALVLGFGANYSSADSEDAPSQTLVKLAGGLAVAAGAIAFLWETLMIVLRVLNIGLLNIKDKAFLGTVSMHVMPVVSSIANFYYPGGTVSYKLHLPL